jgi:LuxR family transcriptional regulator, maltose regulon positive regulatory protein
MGQMLETQAATNVVPLHRAPAGAPRAAQLAGGDARSAPALRGWFVQSLLLEAILRDEAGDGIAAEHALERALELAEQDGVVIAFTVDPVPALLERYVRPGRTHAGLVSEVFRLLGRAGSVAAPAGPEHLSDPLTEGEARVLRYLPTNLSKREIADELYLSPHTIKTHMKHIYMKLEAHNRREAVQRARDHGLLAHPSRGRVLATV